MARRNTEKQKSSDENEDGPIGHPINDNPWFKKMKALNDSMEAGRQSRRRSMSASTGG